MILVVLAAGTYLLVPIVVISIQICLCTTRLIVAQLNRQMTRARGLLFDVQNAPPPNEQQHTSRRVKQNQTR